MSGRLPTLRRLANERGQSLVLALLVLTVLAIVLGTVISFTAGNQRNADLQKASQVARTLAEAGVNNGVSVVSNPANVNALRDDGSTPSLSPGLLPSQANAYTSTYPGGTVQWWGTYSPSDPACPPAQQDANGTTVACVGIWTLHGRSTVANPTGASDLHRTMTAKMAVYTLQNSYSADVWNWVYSPGSVQYDNGTGQCDTTFSNSLTLNVKVWVGGNLCAANTVQFNDSLYVGGYLNLGNPQASVGSQTANVPETYVGNGCWYVNNPVYNPCVVNGTGGGGKKGQGAQTNVYSNSLYTTPAQIPSGSVFSGVTAPPLCWGQGDCPPDSTNPIAGGWYSVASPGPLHPCDVASTSPAGNPLPVFDNNAIWGPAESPPAPNGSVPGVFNLTPDSYSYTCKTVAGELSWNNTTRTLTVQGVVFIDGSVTAYTSGNTPITYTGWGDNGACTSVGSCQSVLFLSGTFLITREQLCAVVNAQGNGCDSSSWDPNKKILIIATHGSGGVQLPAGIGSEVTTNQAAFQGGLYAKSSIVISSGGWVQGPLVSGLETVTDGQSGNLSFPNLYLSPFAINQPPALKLCDPAASSSLPCRPFDYTG